MDDYRYNRILKMVFGIIFIIWGVEIYYEPIIQMERLGVRFSVGINHKEIGALVGLFGAYVFLYNLKNN